MRRVVTVIAGAVGLAAAGYVATRPGGRLVIDDPEISGLELTAGVEAEVVVTVRDTAGRPVRVLGMQPLCSWAACFGPTADGPATVPPGGSVGLVCVVHPGRGVPGRPVRVPRRPGRGGRPGDGHGRRGDRPGPRSGRSSAGGRGGRLKSAGRPAILHPD